MCGHGLRPSYKIPKSLNLPILLLGLHCQLPNPKSQETFAADVKDIVREALQLAGTTERFATLDGKLVYKYAEGRGFLPAFAFGRHEGELYAAAVHGSGCALTTRPAPLCEGA